ncbi:metal-dependent hydrolase [Halorarum halobium]|uniref:metal-dependent hydrolase n=1 Tax=Halorarum halobium TaxID=3075121 RepID=UPI0028AB29C1|nr:metal-dependent hydrolase [Halobaculum sp. XH14]
MMATTHALAGMLLAVPVSLVAPELAPAAFVAGGVGGFVPDLDLYAGHRKTLHYPVYGSVAAVPAVGLAALVPTEATVALAAFLVGAALHARMDVYGGGLELRPWEGTSERAVYDHARGRWRRPRRVVRYDGAPEDLLVSLAFSAPLLVVLDAAPNVQPVVSSLLAVSLLYVALRKPLGRLAASLAALVPARVRGYVPDRYFT